MVSRPAPASASVSTARASSRTSSKSSPRPARARESRSRAGSNVQSLAVTESSEIAQARRAVAALAVRQGFDEEDAGRAALVAMEICSNLVKHGRGGELIAQPLERGASRGVGLIGLDKGPGIADLGKCLRDGFSTGGSRGTGLGAINRIAQMF